MSNHAATDSRLPSSPLESSYHGHQHAPLYAPDSIAVWQSSPPTYTSAPQNYYDFDIEELSDNDMVYPDNAQILRPYELEEVDSPVTDATRVDCSNDVEEDYEDDAQDPESAAFARRLRRMRWKPASRPYSFARSSPVRPNPRKRLRSEALEDTDTDTDSIDSSYARSEPPRARRRTQEPDSTSTLITLSKVSCDDSTTQASTAAMYGDPMDVDEQAT